MIHNSSVIDKKAKISDKVKIGPFCYVGPNVELAEEVELISNVHIEGHTKIGKGTRIFPFASIGTQPQDLKFKNEKNSLSIGENNLIREYVTINPGTEGGGSKTIIGNNCLFMISSHIAHDCKIGDNVIIANNVPLGGHVTIEDNVIIGGNSAVQQLIRPALLVVLGNDLEHKILFFLQTLLPWQILKVQCSLIYRLITLALCEAIKTQLFFYLIQFYSLFLFFFINSLKGIAGYPITISLSSIFLTTPLPPPIFTFLPIFRCPDTPA